MKLETSTHSRPNKGLAFYLGAATAILAIGWSRYLPIENSVLHNFSPVLALFFCGAVYLRGPIGWLIPAVAVIGSDLALNSTYGESLFAPFMLSTYGSYGLAVFAGTYIAKRKSWTTLLGGVAGCSLLFYAVTCSCVWLYNPVYPKSIVGLWQALTLGEPGYPPAYLFLRNSLLSDLLFTGAFASVCEWALAKQAQGKKAKEIASTEAIPS
jgi:hypothetical protein